MANVRHPTHTKFICKVKIRRMQGTSNLSGVVARDLSDGIRRNATRNPRLDTPVAFLSSIPWRIVLRHISINVFHETPFIPWEKQQRMAPLHIKRDFHAT
jgi:hypothetical protein